MPNSYTRLACVMVGLPATGKTFISQKVCRYLNWVGINTKVFNVSNYRRKLYGNQQDHTFFDPNNPTGYEQRQESNKVALKDMLEWFQENGNIVAIFDGTNSTVDKRKYLYDTLTQQNIKVLFIQVTDEQQSITFDLIEKSPDYLEMDPSLALQDFTARINQYKSEYTPLQSEESNYSYIEVKDQVIVNKIGGYLESRIVYYLMNLHTKPRKIYMSRHGESQFNVLGKIGGDSNLSPRGMMYANQLPNLVKDNLGSKDLIVWTSTMKRTIQTGSLLEYSKFQWKALDEIDAGVCDGMTYEEIEEKFPDDYANRDEDKFNYRYKGGESYRDVVLRLEPIIMDLERQENILIIGHQAILRCIYAYFMDYNHEDLPYVKIPLHTLIELTPKAYGCEEKKYKVDIEAVDTHRPKPSATKKVTKSNHNLGASGEIVHDTNGPLLSINP